jgi:site-specific recombinase XerD
MYRQCQEHFFEQFAPTELIEKITADRLLEWRTSMLMQYAPSSVSKFFQTTKMVFDWAVDKDWLTKSPAKKIPNGRCVNREKDRKISMEEYATMLDVCPNQGRSSSRLLTCERHGATRCCGVGAKSRKAFGLVIRTMS